MFPSGVIVNVPIGQWHTLKTLESGTVLLEAKDGKWEAMKEGGCAGGVRVIGNRLLRSEGKFRVESLERRNSWEVESVKRRE